MNKDMIRIASAIVSGATIGGFIARLVNPYIWFVGVVIGGLLAYFSFCWKEVGLAIKKASREAVAVRNPGYFRLVFAREWSFTMGILSFATTVYLQLGVLAVVVGSHYFPFKDIAMFTGIVIGGASLFCVVIGFIHGLAEALEAQILINPPSKWSIQKRMLQNYRRAKEDFVLNALRREFRELVWLVVHIPNAGLAISRFFRTVFITIHSEIRLICGIDTAIGIATGYWIGHSTVFTLVGAVIGVVVGLFNYYMVSIRWLKLKPA